MTQQITTDVTLDISNFELANTTIEMLDNQLQEAIQIRQEASYRIQSWLQLNGISETTQNGRVYTIIGSRLYSRPVLQPDPPELEEPIE